MLLLWLGLRLETRHQGVADLFPGGWSINNQNDGLRRHFPGRVSLEVIQYTRSLSPTLEVTLSESVQLVYHCIPRHQFALGVFGLVEVGLGRWEVWGCPLGRTQWRPLVADTPYSVIEEWSPKNSDGRFMGDPALRIALQNSRSVVRSRLIYLGLCEELHEWIIGGFRLPLSGGVE